MIETLPYDKIRIDGGTQPRMLINTDVVEDYASQIEAGRELPPLVVFHDGAEYWLADGFHRYHARATVLGAAMIECDVREGTQEDAIVYSCGANAEHGLRRTNADKRRAVMIMLSHRPTWSDREIAQHCSVTHPFVGVMRELSGNGCQIRDASRGEVTYKMDVAGLRRRPIEDEYGDHIRPARCPTCGQVVQ